MSSTQLPSLLDSIGQDSLPVTHRPPRRPPLLRRARNNLNSRYTKLKAHLTSDPRRRRRFILFSRLAAAAAVIALAVSAWLIFRPVPKPDYDTAPIDEIFNYTLLTDEFNKLPIEERVRLVGQIVTRIKNMSGSDSALLAAFAAGIMGQAREQIQENVSHMAVDLWDKYALDYAKVPDDQRGPYLENIALEFVKTMETIAGETSRQSDQERLDEFRDQARREREAVKEGRRPVSGRQMSRLFDFANNDMGRTASPAQRQRGAQLLRDVTRHFRGEDISTGRPK
jgi:hypothetical protein